MDQISGTVKVMTDIQWQPKYHQLILAHIMESIVKYLK